MQLRVEKCKRTVALIFHDRCLDSACVCVCVCLLYSGTFRIQRRLMASRLKMSLWKFVKPSRKINLYERERKMKIGIAPLPLSKIKLYVKDGKTVSSMKFVEPLNKIDCYNFNDINSATIIHLNPNIEF